MHQPSPAARRNTLKALLDRGETILVPGCHDALSAMLVAEAGFAVGYVGSYEPSSGAS